MKRWTRTQQVLVAWIAIATSSLVFGFSISGPKIFFGLSPYWLLQILLAFSAFAIGVHRGPSFISKVSSTFIGFITGMFVFVIVMILRNPDNNLLPPAVMLYSIIGAICITIGSIIGHLLHRLLLRTQNGSPEQAHQ